MRQAFKFNLAKAMGRMTATALAQDLGVSTSTVCRWLQGSKMPSLSRAVQIAQYFGLSIDALLEEQAS